MKTGVPKVAWILLLLPVLAFFFFGLMAMLFGLSLSDFPVGIPGGPDAVQSLTGEPWEDVRDSKVAIPLMRGISRVTALGLLGFAIMSLTLILGPFRRGERWAWFSLWTVPLVMLGVLIHDLPGEYVLPAVLLALSLLALALAAKSVFGPRPLDR